MSTDAQRFVALDAIRGAAALAVLFYHLRHMGPAAAMQDAPAPFASGYLGVDLFFAMSGFVVAHAYGHRLGRTLDFRRFLMLRFVRLQPVMAMGVLLGFVLALIQRLCGLPQAPGLFAIATSLPPNLAMLPNVLLPWGIFLFNPPAWSLFYELLANAGYAAVLVHRPAGTRLGARLGAAACLAALLGLLVVAASGKGFDHGVNLADWPVALARIGFSFPLGIVLHRTRARWLQAIPPVPVWCLLLACLVLLAPAPTGLMRSAYDLGFVLIASPLLVMLGATSVPSRRGITLATWLGQISYPLYALHAPVKHLVETVLPLDRSGLLIASTAVSLALAHVVATRLDPAARAALGRLLAHRLSPLPRRTVSGQATGTST